MTLKSRMMVLGLGVLLAAPETGWGQLFRRQAPPAPRNVTPPATAPAGGAARGATPPSFLPTPPSQARSGSTAAAKTEAGAKADGDVKKADQMPPVPIPLEELAAPAMALPEEPLEPYLLRKENGPFMVTARVFRGPDATKFALALTKELRGTFHLPAYIFFLKIQPGGSNIRNVQPTSPREIPIGMIGKPEEYRIYDEAAVLVGNCKTIDEAEKLMHKVKGLHPECLGKLPTIWQHRRGKGLKWAMVTANPLIPAQHLYPGNGHGHAPQALKIGDAVDPQVIVSRFEQAHKRDPLVERMNKGPHSIYHCAGPFTLQVTQYTGRVTNNVNDPKFSEQGFLKMSPLATAADDAEQLAEHIAKCSSLPSGMKPYVYHDRFSSTVTIGSFSGANDPKLAQLRAALPKVTMELLQKKYTQLPLAPATYPMKVPRP